MKKLIRIHLISFLIATVGFVSCDETQEEVDLPTQQDVSVGFSQTQLTFEESGGSQQITLSLSPSIQSDGQLLIEVESADQSKYETIPQAINGLITLPLKLYADSFGITFIPVDNEIDNEPANVSFKIKSVSAGFTIGVKSELIVTIADDDHVTVVQKSVANFTVSRDTLNETDASGSVAEINFSHPLEEASQLRIAYQSGKAIYGQHFRTEPAMENGEFLLSPELNATKTSFKVYPINNDLISGDLEITFRIEQTTGSILYGTILSESLIVFDDELFGLPKGYEVIAGNSSRKETTEYGEKGKVLTVRIEELNPAGSIHTDTYYYNGAGQIERINQYQNIDKVFTWIADQITKSEVIEFGVVKQYTEYTYDQFGNVAGTANYYLQQDGSYSMELISVFLYFVDGNLYKQLTYTVKNGEADALIATKTFDSYLSVSNPFPIVSILPSVIAQKQLPSSYRIEGNGYDLSYEFHYEFREDGKVSKRTSTSLYGSELAQYFYY